MFGLGPIELMIVLPMAVVICGFFVIVLAAAIKILRMPNPRGDEREKNHDSRA